MAFSQREIEQLTTLEEDLVDRMSALGPLDARMQAASIPPEVKDYLAALHDLLERVMVFNSHLRAGHHAETMHHTPV